MWIRSQSKKTLIDLNAICINNEKEIEIIGWDMKSDSTIRLGEYENKERAMFVLNEIQCHITENLVYCDVYEMPEK